LQVLGASLSSSAGLDHSEVRMKTLKQTLAPSAEVFAEVMLSPAFPEDQLERLRKEQHDAIQREKVTPMSMALRVVPRILYGKGHHYAQPLTGSGFEGSVAAINREDVLRFHRETIIPDNCVLIVAGDLTLDEVLKHIGNQLHSWEKGSSASKPHVSGQTETAGSLFFLNRPGSLQSIVIGAYLVDRFDPNLLLSTDLMNDVLGGQFTSRVNMNLREDKHWTYGARSFIVHTEERRPLLVYASVQMDKTLDTIREIRGEFMRIIGDEPITQEEFDKNQSNTIMGLPGQWETNAAVANAINYLIKLGLPDNYYDSYADNLQSLTVDEVRTAAQQMIRPDELCWFVVGDKSMVYEQLKDGAFRSIVELDGED
jgi:predicted Zn-dependent peptidase